MKKLLILILLFDFIFAFARLNVESGKKYQVTCIDSRELSDDLLFRGFLIYEDSIMIYDDIYKDIDSLFGNDYCGVDTIFLISRSFGPYGDPVGTNVFYIMHRDKVMRLTKAPNGVIEYIGEDEMIKEEQSDIFTDSEPVLRDAVRQWPLDTIAKLFTCSTFGVGEEWIFQSIQRIVMSEDTLLEWQYIRHPIDFPAHWSMDLTDKVISEYKDYGVDVNKVLGRKYWKEKKRRKKRMRR